jgi:Tfp pilus assembly protein PilO
VTRTNKILIAAVAAVALIAGYWMLVLSPKREEVAKLDKSIATKEAEAQAAEATLAGFEKARESYGSNYATVVRLGKAVPEGDDTRSLLVQIDSAAKAAGVDFRTISVGGNTGVPAPAPAAAGGTAAATTGETPPPGAVSVGSAGFAAMPLKFSFRGSFFNMSDFFSRLERFVSVRNARMDVTGRLLRVESVVLKPDTTGFPMIRAEIGASSYLLPSSEGLTAGATEKGPAGASAASAPATGGATPSTTTATVSGVTR